MPSLQGSWGCSWGFGAAFQTSQNWGRKSLSHVESVTHWVSKPAPPSPATGLEIGGDEGSLGHSCAGTSSSPLDPAGLGRGDQRQGEGLHALSPLHLDPCCCKVALIPVLSPPPWLFGFFGASGRIHSYKLSERPHPSGSGTLPAYSKQSRRW